MNELLKIKTDVLKLLEQTKGFAQQANLGIKADRLSKYEDALKRSTTFAVVCGEFKRGKSSFINALLETNNLCPVDIAITTNLATQITYAADEEITVIFDEKSKKEPAKIKKEMISDYVTEQKNTKNKEQAKLLNVGLPNEVLKNNSLTIIDTPGVGGLEASHAEVTWSYISIADVLLFVSDATSPLTTDELDFISKAKNVCNNIFFILNKIDHSSNWREIEQENQEKLSKILNQKPEEIKVYPVSSFNKLSYLESGNETKLKYSKFNKLESVLFKELEKSIIQHLIISPLEEIKNELDNIKTKLEIELSAVTNNNKKEIEAQKSQLEACYNSYKKLSSTSSLNKVLREQKNKINKKVSNNLKSSFDRLEDELIENIDNKDYDSANEINSFLDENYLNIIKNCQRHILDSINNTYNEITVQIDLEFETSSKSIIIIENNECLDLKKINDNVFDDKRGRLKKCIDTGQSIQKHAFSLGAYGAVTGGALGGALGVFLGPIGVAGGAAAGAKIGGALGIVAGKCIGFFKRNETREQQQQNDLKNLVRRSCNRNKDTLLTNLFEYIENNFNEIELNTINYIKEQQEFNEQAIKEHKSTLNSSQQELKEKEQVLKNKIEFIKHSKVQADKALKMANNKLDAEKVVSI